MASQHSSFESAMKVTHGSRDPAALQASLSGLISAELKWADARASSVMWLTPNADAIVILSSQQKKQRAEQLPHKIVTLRVRTSTTLLSECPKHQSPESHSSSPEISHFCYVTEGKYGAANAQQCLQPHGQEPCRDEDLCWQRSAPVIFSVQVWSSNYPLQTISLSWKLSVYPFIFLLALYLAHEEMISPMPS